jgi:hypothetical protein
VLIREYLATSGFLVRDIVAMGGEGELVPPHAVNRSKQQKDVTGKLSLTDRRKSIAYYQKPIWLY